MMEMMKQMGFIGLGTMGEPMAGHALKARGSLVVWNRTASKADRLVSLGAEKAATVGDLAARCEVIAMCVNTSEDAKSVAEQIGLSAGRGTLVLDHSTIAPAAAEEIYCLLGEKGIRFVDAPITGGSMGAQAGTLTIFMGGDQTDVDEGREAVAPYSRRAERVGGSGKGQWMKLANQIASMVAVSAMCECLSFAEKAGLDLKQAKEMIGSGAAGSWAFENYGNKVLNRDWSLGFSIANQLKDLGYCETAGAAIDAKIPVTKLVAECLKEMAQEGRSNETTAALFEWYEGRK